MSFAANPTEQWRRLTRVIEVRLAQFTVSCGFDTAAIGQSEFTDRLIWSLPLARELQAEESIAQSFFPYSHHAVIDLRPIGHWGDWACADAITILATGEETFQIEFQGICQSLSPEKQRIVTGKAAALALLNTYRKTF